VPDQPYNPLAKVHLAESITSTLLKRPRISLAEIGPPFEGAGIYVLYYTGRFPAYREIASRRDSVIYVGKAVPSGSRKGIERSLETPAGQVLYARLQEHRESIEQAAHIRPEEFDCRYLVVDDIFIPLAESLLINKYEPIWNIRLTGFGNHDPGSGRYKQQRSPWDTVHPGRDWAMRCAANKKAAQIIAEFGGGECPSFPPRVS
jgi:hypothetical protein